MDEKIKALDAKMKKAYDYLTEDLATIRAGRANPHVLDRIRVDYYGTPTPIQQVGNITVPEPRMLQIAPWEKNLIKEIEKAILASFYCLINILDILIRELLQLIFQILDLVLGNICLGKFLEGIITIASDIAEAVKM